MLGGARRSHGTASIRPYILRLMCAMIVAADVTAGLSVQMPLCQVKRLAFDLRLWLGVPGQLLLEP